MKDGMIATGNHGYPDSLCGAPPSPAALIRAAFKLFEPGHFIGIKKERPEGRGSAGAGLDKIRERLRQAVAGGAHSRRI